NWSLESGVLAAAADIAASRANAASVPSTRRAVWGVAWSCFMTTLVVASWHRLFPAMPGMRQAPFRDGSPRLDVASFPRGSAAAPRRLYAALLGIEEAVQL